MAGLTPDEELAEAEKERQRLIQEAETQRSHTTGERVKDRRSTVILTTVSGVMALTGGLGSQLISRYEREPTKTAAYVIEVADTPFDGSLRNTVIKVNSETGDTWYARKRTDGAFEWVQISNQANASIPSAVAVPSTSPATASPTRFPARQ